MAKVINITSVTDKETGITYDIKLSDVYLSFGGHLQVTSTKNKGKEKEKVLQTSGAQTRFSVNAEFNTEEDFAKALVDNPILKEIIPMIIKKAESDYLE